MKSNTDENLSTDQTNSLKAQFEGFPALTARDLSSRKCILQNTSEEDIGLCGRGYDGQEPAGRETVEYGGNIVADSRILTKMKEKNEDGTGRGCQNFRRLYGVEHGKIDKEIKNAPRTITDLYNWRATMITLGKWASATEHRTQLAAEIKNKCSQAIDLWESWVMNGKNGTDPIREIESLAEMARKAHFELRVIGD